MIKLDNGCTVIEQVIHEVSGGVKSITVIAVDSGLGKVIGDMGVVCWEVSPSNGKMKFWNPNRT